MSCFGPTPLVGWQEHAAVLLKLKHLSENEAPTSLFSLNEGQNGSTSPAHHIIQVPCFLYDWERSGNDSSIVLYEQGRVSSHAPSTYKRQHSQGKH